MPTTNVTIDTQALALPTHVADLLDTCAGWVFPRTRQEILDLAMGGRTDVFEIAYDEDRDACIARMKRALREFTVEGIKTTIPFHQRVLEHRCFKKGQYTTKFVEEQLFNSGDLVTPSLKE